MKLVIAYFKTLAISALTILLIVGLSSCKKENLSLTTNPPQLQGGLINNTLELGLLNGKEFSVTAFKSGLQNRIATSASTTPRGYSFVISKNGQMADTSSFGTAAVRNGVFSPMHRNQEINIASVTKLMTAVAVMQLIKKNNLTIQSKIGGWLPTYWNAKQAIKDLTFEELMTHSSGLAESNTGYDSLKATVARGLDNPAKPFDVYANINFALFRAMIPYLRDKNAATQQEQAMVPSNTSGFENWLSTEYIEYMQEKVFTPIGMGTATCTPSSNTAQAFGESSNPMALINAELGDWKNTCGGGGYFMSVMEMARFMAYLSHSTVLLDNTQKALMDIKRMGWDNEDSPMTIAGRAYGKDGALWWDSNNNNSQGAGDAGLQTFVMKFPNGVELSLAINSIPGNYRNNLTTLITSAYNAAWLDK